MSKVKDIKLVNDQKFNQVTEVLSILQQTFEQLKEEVDTTCVLRQIGAETTLSRMIEEAVSNPSKSLFAISGQINKQVRDFVIDLTHGYFKEVSRNIPMRVYRRTSVYDDLLFLVVLEKDNNENRTRVFDFFDTYDILDISKKFPITFQFTPAEYLASFREIEEIPVD